MKNTDVTPERLHCGCLADGSPHATACPTVLGDIAHREQRWKDPDWVCPRCQGVNFAVRQSCRFCGFDSALVVDGTLLEPVDDPASVGRVLAEVRVRREEQDEQHGGPEHDDTHTPIDWDCLVQKALLRAGVNAIAMAAPPRTDGFISAYRDPATNYEDALLDVAALAVAAIQSSRRKHARA